MGNSDSRVSIMNIVLFSTLLTDSQVLERKVGSGLRSRFVGIQFVAIDTEGRVARNEPNKGLNGALDNLADVLGPPSRLQKI